MPQDLPSSSAKVQAFLAEHHSPFVVQLMPDSTRTAADAANTIGCGIAQIAKSLIFKNHDTGEGILVVLSGCNRVCPAKVKTATGLTLKRADAEFVRDNVGFAIGGIPPVAHRHPLRTFLDQDLQQFSEIWAAAGTPNTVFKLCPQDLPELTGGEWINLAE